MKPRHAALAASLVAAVALVAYATTQDPKASPSPAASPAVGASPAAGAPADPNQMLYAIGVLLGNNVRQFNLTATELEHVKRGITDAATGKKPEVDVQAVGPRIQEFVRSRMTAAAEAEKARGQAFRDAAAKETGAVLAPSGLVYKETTAGTGRSPASTDTVRVHYRGTLIDGTEFDSSISRGEPAEFPLNGVIPCWTEGVQRMKVGGKARLVCPAAIAYGDQGRPPAIPGGATLVFDVELLEVKAAAAAAPPSAPRPVPTASPAAAPRPVPTVSPAAAPSPAAKPSPTATPQP